MQPTACPAQGWTLGPRTTTEESSHTVQEGQVQIPARLRWGQCESSSTSGALGGSEEGKIGREGRSPVLFMLVSPAPCPVPGTQEALDSHSLK